MCVTLRHKHIMQHNTRFINLFAYVLVFEISRLLDKVLISYLINGDIFITYILVSTCYINAQIPIYVNKFEFYLLNQILYIPFIETLNKMHHPP